MTVTPGLAPRTFMDIRINLDRCFAAFAQRTREQDAAGGQEQVTGKAILFSVTPTVMIACGFNRSKAIL